MIKNKTVVELGAKRLTDDTLLDLLDLLGKETEVLAVLDPHLEGIIVDVHVALILITATHS